MKAFYGSRFSPNMTRTPEGFLICHNVPIARTGWQDYLGQEIGLSDMYNKIIPVYRSPEEVFHPATIASFEGKSVTDEHPTEAVIPENAASYEKGHIQNVRQGAGQESDLLVGDLFIKSPNLISEIEAGKREVSCGYDCFYEPLEDGKYKQVQIRGNHVAIVESGRAGNRVAIKDNKPKLERSKNNMKAKDQKGILAKVIAAFAKDAEPDELAEAVDAMYGGKDAEIAQPAATEAKEANQNTQILEMLQNISSRLEVLEKSDKEVHNELPKDALDELENELAKQEPEAKDSMGEESVTIPVEEIKDEETTEKVANADKSAMLQAIKDMKPAVAAIKDPAERKRVSDALAKTFRQQIGVSPSPAKNTYGQITKAIHENAKQAHDSAKSNRDNSDFGKKCAERNPHVNKGGK